MAEDLHKKGPWSQRLKDWEAGEPGPAPLPGDWERLSRALDEKPRRRVAAWWWFGSLLLIGVTATLWFLSTSESTLETQSLTTLQEVVDPNKEAEHKQPNVVAEERQSMTTTNSLVSTDADSQTDVEPDSFNKNIITPAEPSHFISSITTNTPKPETGYDFQEAFDTDKGELPAIISLAPIALAATAEPVSNLLFNSIAKDLVIHSLIPNASINWELPGLSLPDPLPVVTFVEKENSPGAAFKIALGPHLAIHRPEININLPANTLRSTSLVNSTAFAQGINVQFNLGERWGLQTGFNHSVENSLHQFATAQRFDRSREINTTDGDGLSKYQVEYATSYTKGAAEVELLRPGSVFISENRFVRLQVQLEEEVKTFSLPLLLTYDIAISTRFKLRLAAGVVWNKQKVAVDLKSRLAALIDLRVVNSEISEQDLLLNDQYWTGQVATGVVYAPFNKWELVLTPRWNTSLSNLSVEPTLKADYNRFSFSTGINYRF